VSLNSIPITISVQDVNDNKPLFTSETYYALITQISKAPQEVLTFEVKDKDSGKYGLNGLVCSLMGRGSEKYFSRK
jgi:hypothetical protein